MTWYYWLVLIAVALLGLWLRDFLMYRKHPFVRTPRPRPMLPPSPKR